MINVDSTVHESMEDGRFVYATDAARLLGVRKETLYAYVSRGFLTRHGGARSRGSFYLRSEIVRLKARHDARSGHGPVAATALRWGEPVLDSAITGIDERGPRYRGVVAVDLALASVPFENVCELLWKGALAKDAAHFPAAPALVKPGARRERDPFHAFSHLLVALRDEARTPDTDSPAMTLDRARFAVAVLASFGKQSRGSIAERVAASLGIEKTKARLAAIDAALVLVADHELNASSFAARVAASTGADLHACLLAALHTASGHRHGAASVRVEALLAEVDQRGSVARTLEDRLRLGDPIPGFGHPLYPGGDPRTAPLLTIAKRIAPGNRTVRSLLALAARAASARGELPNVDAALVALASALGAPSGSAQVLFVLGRVAGWVAHAVEQRAAGFILRPRARYVGP
ncbi:citrate/2-methylcitrate synthase [soil metagenome]